ncbi:MAG: hypothetical protein HFI19_06635 [Lachnospiraceae bacterium]|jgi:hypothetical protein|uniref:DUF6551 family protein n=1 Tax=Candidatus Merdisoma sp. JLR.KK006 TaxID=3112626 RepID=UPI002FEFE2CD|nr:hypothetical protein [Lachnospiraceae bacterium]
MLEKFKKNVFVDNEKKMEDLIILYDMGYDTGRYSHIRIQLGLVDARTVKSATEEEEGGYQRLLKFRRVIDITGDFHWSRLNPITICIRADGDRYNVDGQARVSSVITLYKKGEISTPMIPCLILTNTTLEDEAMLFGTQDDGKTPLREYQKAKSKYIGKDKKICALADTLSDCGIRLFTDIQAYKTIREIYDNTDLEVFKRFCKVISSAWLNGTKAQKKNATCGDILTGLSIFYSKYANEIDDRNLTKKLSEKTPDAVRELFNNYKNELDPDRKYLKTFTVLYNKGKRKDRIDYM